jgi:2-oxoglutarate dehydrogenase dihydrolipoamide succinyltransferase (E2 component)
LATPVTMPQLGETVVEGTITKWLKKEGDSVARDEPLFEISTDKVDTEVPSPLAGTVVAIKVPEGETVKVGTELAIIDAGGDGQVTAAPEPESNREPEPASSPPAEPAAQSATPAPEERIEAAADASARSGILSPLVRRLAEEHGIDLSQVPGTGTGGRITKKDVMDYVERGERPPMPQPEPVPEPLPQPQPMPQPEPVPPSRVAATTREEAIPLSRMRRSIAANMVASIQTSARAWNLTEVNMEIIVRTRTAAKDSFQAREGIALTYMPFVARAVCDALLAYPDVNSELREDELVLKHYVNLGIAVALDDGLIVPVIKGADVMNIVGLARAINDVATRARNKKLNPDDVHGGTFTITNPGPFGSIISVPIINPPQCAILAFDAIEKRPVVIDDAIAIRHMVYLSMSWDHRIIDGATAAKFLARVKQNLETWDFGPEVGLPAR